MLAMKAVTILCEYLAGIVVALISLISCAVGGIIGLFDLPRYFRLKAK
jgi:hypothetical protein